MKVSWIKQQGDDKNFRIAERLGMKVYKIQNPEEVDDKIKTIIDQKYDTIVLSNEMAGFSEDIIKKYANNKDINIIISTRK